MTTRRPLLLAGIAIALVAAACSSGPEAPPPSPSPFFGSGPSGPPISTGPTASGATGEGVTGPTGATVPLPTSSPGSGTGNLTRGAATVRVTGDLRVTKTLSQMVSTVYDAGGGIALVWTAGGADPSTFGIGGLAFIGTKPTSPQLTMTLAVPSPDGGFESFVSFDGECRITIRTAAGNELDGSFRCAGLRSGSAVADAAGTFTASG